MRTAGWNRPTASASPKGCWRLDGDGYLCAEVVIGGEPRACVGHVINDFVLPLVSEHAGAVLGLYPELLPEGSEESEELADAPDLTVP